MGFSGSRLSSTTIDSIVAMMLVAGSGFRAFPSFYLVESGQPFVPYVLITYDVTRRNEVISWMSAKN